MSRIFVW